MPTKTQRVLNLSLEMLFNFGLPYILYAAESHKLGEVHALLLSSLPPIVWSGVELIRKRRLDAISLIVLLGIALSLLAFLGGGSVHLLQLREKLVTGIIGCIFLGSAAIGRPLLLEVALTSIRQTQPEEADRLRENQGFRRGIRVMTLAWGFGLVAEAAVACFLVLHMPVQRFLVVGPILGYCTTGLLGAWTFWYGKQMKRRGEARRAAAQAQPSMPPRL